MLCDVEKGITRISKHVRAKQARIYLSIAYRYLLLRARLAQNHDFEIFGRQMDASQGDVAYLYNLRS